MFDADITECNFIPAKLTYANIAITAMDPSQIPSYYNQHEWHRLMYLYTDGKGHFKLVSQRLKYLETGV